MIGAYLIISTIVFLLFAALNAWFAFMASCQWTASDKESVLFAAAVGLTIFFTLLSVGGIYASSVYFFGAWR